MQITIPALQGVQGAHVYWIAQLTLRTYLQLTTAPDADVSPEDKAQRDLSEARASKLAEYILSSPDYVLPAVTLLASETQFTDGKLTLPWAVNAIQIADGQHRRRAVEIATGKDPLLLEQTIPATIFPAEGLERARQVFVDINSAAPVPITIKTFYQPGKDRAALDASRRSPFTGLIEYVKPNPSPKSGKLWSLTALCRTVGLDQTQWWEEVLPVLPGFTLVASGKLSAKECRDSWVWAHGVGLEALGRLAGKVTAEELKRLPPTFWSRKSLHWIGRCTDGSRMLANSRSVGEIVSLVEETVNTLCG